MRNFAIVLVVLLPFLTLGMENTKITQEDYINQWKDIAIEQMRLHQIPASITLAQGMLESGNGTSDLAKIANNHFGIKCAGWQGETFFKDDETKNECFRKYKNAAQSFEDHSLFLKNKTRYAGLFQLELSDYKNWAKGLKDAGYATNPKYPQLLIDLIEKFNLNQYDQYSSTIKNQLITHNDKKSEIKIITTENKHEVLNHKNNIKYIIAKKGDTYYRLSKEFSMGLWQLYKYNEFAENKDCLNEGDIIYLEPKKSKSHSNKTLEVVHNCTIREVAQKEGIKVKKLIRFNHLSSPDDLIKKGTILRIG